MLIYVMRERMVTLNAIHVCKAIIDPHDLIRTLLQVGIIVSHVA